ncbi:MAG: hypothetical protein ACRDZY_02095, partial [Acidimicrobiales bacterium]
PGGHVTSTVRQWDRRDWGEGGQAFAWWCLEAAEAFSGARPAYRSLAEELVALVGPEPYRLVSGYLDSRLDSSRAGRRAVPLPHPAARHRHGSSTAGAGRSGHS